ncbi:amino acid ABC transporter ATP-binding protein [Bosea sp. (in: a-proteobacteria)]|uniref:amino acid ABC transporter ATP-binding protein n=1 Tax=Bosea sp. (in: a-proteobacteria) TaxID=1871050 RepID=UPI00260E3619|nr:ATP-binding cassette domain-containing protein [Bosea sp. (in: a-proteobacteria)]MCO5091440.1 ATP-binding cassette domain-containing protein [Bosea sp. (in: a-proteobacteria)]
MDAAQGTEADGVSVTLAHVEKSFGGVRALDDVSLSVGAGTVLCVIGPPGAGKSTLLRCVGGLETIDRGTIRLDGGPVAPLIGERADLPEAMTALQQIIEGPLSGLKRPRRQLVAAAMAALERVGLADRRDAYPAELSGAERQCVAIARALAVRPGLMLFDAPTAGLEPDEAGAVLEVMRGLAAGGMTMIVVTDALDFVRAAASAVIFMDEGKIVAPAPGLAMRAGLP